MRVAGSHSWSCANAGRSRRLELCPSKGHGQCAQRLDDVAVGLGRDRSSRPAKSEGWCRWRGLPARRVATRFEGQKNQGRVYLMLKQFSMP
eukprot:3649931-Prymnesium_polylepis.1